MNRNGKDQTEQGAPARRGRGRPQLRSDDETRALIYDAARREFSERGFAAANIADVACRAGVSTKTLYRLIPTKLALFEGTVTDRMDRFISAVNLGACDGRDIAAALEAALSSCGELILDAEVIALQRIILADSDKFPDIAEMFYEKAMQRTLGALAAWLSVQQRRGRIAVDDAQAAAGMLLGMLVFQPQRDVMYGHRPPPSRAQIEARAKACAALFLSGCAVPSDQIKKQNGDA
ncbi:TetR/AcrR family transcriptional regulator [Bradyrhizobium elkanii]|uniref:TetR/AcrR family transcriptional regulator n=2 Tax=Bradyrhizobium elkanii TaxID=29448 RepID=UPI0002E72932|nr:TetR/AcrR family transcriptional regulator [Bradyrhizobium elkanii]MCP1756743.1 AcrR family transcriptional regulator [Bradyrhizobium elkanii]MCP1982256.1 AcrR family transcriptional regulator [Bradyrhizobium elkanii]MCS3882960.1 AcrR family transcriptional regulator [Bradyrhizobium elkanii]MCS4217983.1 AcrR family transcriptional regulator [Bradyrhizobium elkanii]MCW2195567.1 AcrR family transcriptional regulator [Bradyrhizobium elkanii]